MGKSGHTPRKRPKRSKRARTLGIPGVRNQQQLIEWLMERFDGICQLCNCPIKNKSGNWGPSVDHIIPQSRGGIHHYTNIQLTHSICNNKKGNSLDGNGQSGERNKSETTET